MLGMNWDESSWEMSDLEPDVREIIQRRDELNVPPVYVLSVDGAKELLEQVYEPPEEREPVENWWDTKIPGQANQVTTDEEIPIRIYSPFTEESGPLPVLIWFHGGGFVFGNRDTSDQICRRFANSAECIVISVEYRLAPEFPFPAALKDCYIATWWVSNHSSVFGADSNRLAVGGGSAGGNLTAAVSLLSRDLKDPVIDYQICVYPTLDFGMPLNFAPKFDSYAENPDGLRSTQWYAKQYFSSPIDSQNPYASPLRAESFEGMPPGEVVTVEFDVLRDEGAAYANMLSEAGVDVTYTHFDRQIHPFLNMETSAASNAIESMATRFRQFVG